jgi:hypothetical protein
MMTRFILAAMQLFGVAAATAIAVALLAPIDAIRFLGVVALFFAGAGLLVQLNALQRFDPHAYRVLRFRLRATRRRARAFGARLAAKLTAALHHASSARSVR